MSLPPSNKLAACLEVLYCATLRVRMIGWRGEKDGLSANAAAELAALMDAVHNIPHLIQRWEDCDEELLRGTLKDFDARFKGGLVDSYDRISASAG